MASLARPARAQRTVNARATGGRPAWIAAGLMILGTLAVATTSYSLSARVAAERRDVERLERQNRALNAEIRALNAELKVRMRLPQLQRWNDEVLGLVPVSARQFAREPHQLLAYGRSLEGEGAPPAAHVRPAIRDVPVPPADQPAPARLIAVAAAEEASALPPPSTRKAAGTVAGGREPAPVHPAVSPPAPVLAATEPLRPTLPPETADLLHQVELAFPARRPGP